MSTELDIMPSFDEVLSRQILVGREESVASNGDRMMKAAACLGNLTGLLITLDPSKNTPEGLLSSMSDRNQFSRDMLPATFEQRRLYYAGFVYAGDEFMPLDAVFNNQRDAVVISKLLKIQGVQNV